MCGVRAYRQPPRRSVGQVSACSSEREHVWSTHVFCVSHDCGVRQWTDGMSMSVSGRCSSLHTEFRESGVEVLAS